MWRWARWVLVGAGAVGAVWFVWDSHVRAAQQRSRDAVYDAKLDDLRKTYPVGTSRGEIEKRLGAESNRGEIGEVEMFLGSYPGDGWVCSRWSAYAQFRFGNADHIESEPLVKIQKKQIRICL